MLSATSSLSYFEAFGQLLVNRNLQRAFIHRPGQPTSLCPACQMKKNTSSFRQKTIILLTPHRVKLPAAEGLVNALTFPWFADHPYRPDNALPVAK